MESIRCKCNNNLTNDEQLAAIVERRRRTFRTREVGKVFNVGFILFCALSSREVSANIITEGRRWIVAVERLGIEMEVALRVALVALLFQREVAERRVVNISPTSP